MTHKFSPAARLRALIAEHAGDGGGGPLSLARLAGPAALPDQGLAHENE